jgi:hypothetical protein
MDIVNLGDPANKDECVRAIRTMFGIPLDAPLAEGPPIEIKGSYVVYCPAFDLNWSTSLWIGKGEHKVKMCPKVENPDCVKALGIIEGLAKLYELAE